jgi:hypothetical protein
MTPVHPVHVGPQEPPPSPEDSERRCFGCGYDLRGLPAGGRCPECGLPMVLPREIDEPLSRMPISVIMTFCIACWFASLCAVAMVVVMLGGRWLRLTGEARAAMLLGLAGMWAVAAWLLTPTFDLPQAAYYGFARAGRLRHAARLLQTGWILAAGAMYIRSQLPLTASQGMAASWLSAAGVIGLIVGLAGIVALGVVLHRLADWVRDDVAKSALNLALWGAPTLSLLLLILPLGLFLGRLTIILAVLWIISVAAIPFGLVSLSRSVTWSIRHSHEHHQREVRRRDRAERFGEEVSGRVKRMDEARQHVRRIRDRGGKRGAP